MNGPSSLGTATVGKIFHVPHDRNRFFTGREGLLQQVREGLLSDRIKAISQVRAISGLGGVGKTQTAVEYCYRHFHDQQDYDFVFWVRSETEQELKSDLVETARQIGLRFDERDPDTALPALRRWFQEHNGWLLVFDNADEPRLLLDYIPRQDDGRGHVLVTSRARRFASLGAARPLEMPVMPEEEGVSFLRKRLAIPQHEEGISPDADDGYRELVHELGGLPLALEQAAAYMSELEYGPRDYLKLYRTQELALLEKALPESADYHRDKDVPPSVATTWLLNFEQVQRESPAAADLLTASSFLAPDEIPIQLIVDGASHLGEQLSRAVDDGLDGEQVVRELLAALSRFSLAGLDPDGTSFSIHRLVQRVARDQLAVSQIAEWLERCVQGLNAAFPSVEFQAWPCIERIVPHVLQLAAHLGAGKFASQAAGRLCNQAALYLTHRGQYKQAEPLYEQALAIGRETLGERHPDYANWLNNLASIYRKLGKLAEAEPLIKQALAIGRETLGEKHAAYASTLNNLAGLYEQQGKLAEAEPLYKQALAIGRKTLGERHPDYAIWLNNLANLYEQQWKLAEAESLFRQALAIGRETLGERHPAHATKLNNLANLYLGQGKLAEAEPLYEQALAIGRETLGERHPDYATTLNNLASLYELQGKLAEAEPLYEQSLQIFVDGLGEQHPSCQAVRGNLARVHQKTRAGD